MTDATTPKPSAADARMMQTCLVLYGVYAVGALAGFIPLRSIMLLSSIALMAAVRVAYHWRPKAGETFYETHFHWLIRTFWIGGFIYLPVLTVVAAIAVYAAVDWSDVQAALRTAAMEHNPGAPDDDMKVVTDTVLKEVMQRNGTTIAAIVFGCILPVIAWWLWRCWKGFRLLKAGQPVPNVMKWV